jgi:hypothetical protein
MNFEPYAENGVETPASGWQMANSDLQMVNNTLS